uniref:Uncharacterized protein n=1 Tax=Romanomermis culicivorax TaxID=13658 RepID=A0A915JK91_ROMCU
MPARRTFPPPPRNYQGSPRNSKNSRSHKNNSCNNRRHWVNRCHALQTEDEKWRLASNKKLLRPQRPLKFSLPTKSYHIAQQFMDSKVQLLLCDYA